MARQSERNDSRLSAARYRVDRLAAEWDDQVQDATAERPRADTDTASTPAAVDAAGPTAAATPAPAPAPEADAGQPTMEQRAQYVEIAIQQAIRRGEFDDLPGAGKPLQGLGGTYDPDWWIRRKIERERLTGLGPPALTLRTENAELEARLDAQYTEEDVRRTLTDFNRRVVEARRQLQGGPPVVTATRDVDAEVAAWRSRRDTRATAAREAHDREEAAIAALPWRDRRRARRAQAHGRTTF